MLENVYYVARGLSGVGSIFPGKGDSSLAHVVGLTSAELKGLAATLGKEYRADTDHINDGYPVLTGQSMSSRPIPMCSA